MSDQNADDPFDVGEDKKGFVSEFVRKMAWGGLGAVFMGEEGIRRLAGQLKLPKEVLGSILQQANNTKEDIGRIVSEEVRKFLQSDRLRDEVLKMISGMTLEIKAEVKLVPDRLKDETPSVLPKVKVTELKTKYSPKKDKTQKSPEEA
jgi:hypothetical protein